MTAESSLPPTPAADFFADSERVWVAVSDCVERFLAAWEEGPNPSIGDFLPSEAEPRAIALAELVKVDLEQQYEKLTENPPSIAPKTLKVYAQEFPELLSDGKYPVDLLYEEYHLCRDSQRLTPAAYASQYPQQKTELLRILGDDDPFESTAILQAKPAQAVQPGEYVCDFELLQRLGEGAFATVFLARQQTMQRLVAVKLSADHGREPETLARLDHPHIVRVYDQKLDEAKKLRVLYMQYLPAGTLQSLARQMSGLSRDTWNGQTFLHAVDQVLDECGADPPEDSRQRQQLAQATWWEAVCLLGSQLADALHYAHSVGVLHRDIKPANILVSEAATPKLADFNVSSCSKVTGATPAAYFGGSLGYMSPEQLEACNPRHPREPDDLDGRSDLYSLAMVMWEMLAGRRPFEITERGLSQMAAVERLTELRRAGLQACDWEMLPEDCPAGLRRVFAKAMHSDRNERFVNGAQFADRLRLCLTPDAERLMTETNRVKSLLCRFPLMFTVISLMLPNALAGRFNFVYNEDAIIKPMGAHGPFRVVQLLINGVAFPLGFAVGTYFVWSVVREIVRRTKNPPQHRAALDVRQQCLRVGNRLACLGLVEWMIAGIAYPVGMTLAGATISRLVAFHFVASLLLCGMIAATYPFFGTTAMVIEAWYPRLIHPDRVPKADLPLLRWLEKLCWRYLVIAGAIPLFALTLLSTIGANQSRWALAVVSAGGLALFGLTFVLAQRIQRSVQLLINAEES